MPKTATQAAASFEDTLLADELTPDQLDRIVEAFASDSDVGQIAAKTDIPRQLVLRALEDGSLADRAIAAKRGALSVRFMGVAMDRLIEAVEAVPTLVSYTEKVQAIKLLRDFLGLRAPAPQRLDRPTPKGKDEPPPKRSFESLLAEAEEDDA